MIPGQSGWLHWKLPYVLDQSILRKSQSLPTILWCGNSCCKGESTPGTGAMDALVSPALLDLTMKSIRFQGHETLSNPNPLKRND